MKAGPDRHWDTHTPEGKLDAIVIGSGMGGMTCAALLAELGLRVLVLEQHYEPGGFTHTFKRKSFRWDVGVHAVGEVSEHSMTGRLLSTLSDGQLEWASLGPVYDQFHWPDEFRIDFPDNPEQFQANLIEAFPGEREAIDQYLRQVRTVSGAMKGYYLARTLPQGLGRAADQLFARTAQRELSRKTADVLGSMTGNAKLRSVLAAQWAYYGSPPSRSSFAMQALVAKHFLWGGYYPVGGSREIARHLLHKVAAAGGWTTIRAEVEQIVIEQGRAVGVRLRGPDGGVGQELRAPRIISAAGVWSTVTRMLPPEHARAAWSQSIADLDPAPAHVCLYLGFEGDIRPAGASAANKWFYETWDIEAEGWAIDRESIGRAPLGPRQRAPVLYCSFPSLKDPRHDPGPKQLHTGEVVTFVPWKVFEPWMGSRWQRRGDDYEQFKQRLHDALLAQFLEHMPELGPKIVHAELSTPLTTDHFVRPHAGSIYGLEPTPRRFANRWLRPRSPIPGLVFAGSEITTVGVMGAMMGGVLAAVSAEPVRAAKLLAKIA